MLKFIQAYTEFHSADTEDFTGWYWSLCLIIVKFTHGDTEFYRE